MAILSDDEYKGLMKKLATAYRRKVVRTLLAGNDTCCFSTAQFRDEYLKQHPYFTNDQLEKVIKGDWPRVMLKALGGYVREVKPDVWTRG